MKNKKKGGGEKKTENIYEKKKPGQEKDMTAALGRDRKFRFKIINDLE